jgi:hypothetical protein
LFSSAVNRFSPTSATEHLRVENSCSGKAPYTSFWGWKMVLVRFGMAMADLVSWSLRLLNHTCGIKISRPGCEVYRSLEKGATKEVMLLEDTRVASFSFKFDKLLSSDIICISSSRLGNRGGFIPSRKVRTLVWFLKLEMVAGNSRPW